MYKASTPVRMCVACRGRYSQNMLTRLQCDGRELVKFSGNGRSFYLCKDCIQNENKNLIRALSSRCKKSIKITDLKRVVDG